MKTYEEQIGKLIQLDVVEDAVGADRIPEQDGYVNHGALVDCPIYALEDEVESDSQIPVETVYILRSGQYWIFNLAVQPFH